MLGHDGNDAPRLRVEGNQLELGTDETRAGRVSGRDRSGRRGEETLDRREQLSSIERRQRSPEGTLPSASAN